MTDHAVFESFDKHAAAYSQRIVGCGSSFELLTVNLTGKINHSDIAFLHRTVRDLFLDRIHLTVRSDRIIHILIRDLCRLRNFINLHSLI